MLYLRTLALSLLSALALNVNAEPTSVQIDCDVAGFGVKFSFQSALTTSDPDQHLEMYTMRGLIHFEDARRPDLKFTKFQAFGEFDNSRGVIRFRLMPIAPILFNAFENIDFKQETNGNQVIGISSGDQEHGPNGGTSGHLCEVQIR